MYKIIVKKLIYLILLKVFECPGCQQDNLYSESPDVEERAEIYNLNKNDSLSAKSLRGFNGGYSLHAITVL